MLDLLWRILGVAAAITIILILAFFPHDTDKPLTASDQAALQKYYAAAYSKQKTQNEEPDDSIYVRVGAQAAEKLDVKGRVAKFTRDYGLLGKAILDVGAGRGYLQDIVENYTALEISPSSSRFFHKRFVLGSATAMPLDDNEFDAVVSIWVLEHVPNPETALQEIRRVTKPSGLLYLMPAWDCTPWAAQGYPVRPYSGLSLPGKLLKTWIPFHEYSTALSKAPIRSLRHAAWKVEGGPTRLRYTRLKPNYDTYWMPDSDAVNSLDPAETALWFQSRGDECLNCADLDLNGPLIVRVRKPRAAVAQSK